MTVWPSCSPSLYEHKRVAPLLFPPLDVVYAVAPLFSLHPRPGPALSSVRDTCPRTHPEEGGCASRLHEGRRACLLGLIIFQCDFIFFSFLPPLYFIIYLFIYFLKFNTPPPPHMRQLRFGLWRGEKKKNEHPLPSSTRPQNPDTDKPGPFRNVPRATDTCRQLPLC